MNSPKHGSSVMTPMAGKSRWSPYLVGAGIGMLSWATFGHPPPDASRDVDTSTAF
jgi:hypothetical protein